MCSTENMSVARKTRYCLRKLRGLYNWLMLPNKDTTVQFRGFNFLIRNPRKSLIGRSVFLTGAYEKEVTEFIYPRIKEGMTVVDVGADVGYYTLLFASRVGPSGKVHAFEPIPKSKEYLDENVRINKLENVITYDFALYDTPGTVCLEAPLKKSKLDVNKKNLSKGDIQVQMKVFDDLAITETINAIDFMKLDVEGAELNVLRGMKRTLKEKRPKLLVEVHEALLKSFHFTRSDLIGFLSDMNYTVTSISADSTVVFCE